ncbi:agamous-like MADS-box protein AGL62 [Primulina eburnea]|uniref:agamous-like MADS-box protein AGL62 n=1 Tax=Primulina eburnea TaxID=1245227 RepID=UPI003C6BE373
MAGKTRGRQKIEMAKMSKARNLLVTFSKRRTGLFKKASELCTLCGAEIAIIVFSPGKKVFSFGHPAVDSIIDRYLSWSSNSNTLPSATSSMQLVEAHRVACVRELNMYLNDMVGELEVEKRRGEEVRRLREATHGVGSWWEAPVEEMGLKDLEQLKAAMEELRNNVSRQVGKVEAKQVVVESSLFSPALGVVPPCSGVGDGGLIRDNKAPAATGIGQLSFTPRGYTLVFGQPLF